MVKRFVEQINAWIFLVNKTITFYTLYSIMYVCSSVETQQGDLENDYASHIPHYSGDF